MQVASIIKNIKSIQVFDVAAQLKNLTRTAEFLNTSQSTVSYHIKKLEDDVGVPLFERSGTGLKITAHGEILALHVAQALSLIQSGLDQVANRRDLVRIAVLPMFASRWLSPRLGLMWEAHPGLEIAFLNHNNDFVYSAQPSSFADLGIHWGRGDWPGFHVTHLWNEELVAVCSPDYQKESGITDLSDLKNCTMLHVDDKRMWSEVLKDNLIELSSPQREILLEDRHFQLNATINGLGVSLFSRRMIKPELESGLLVQLFDCSFKSSFAYHLVVPKETILSPAATRFKDWLLQSSRSSASDAP
ncbi:LysR family transcriptional regulator [Pseudorhodobacter turbinis]|nr:LysR substrate-binding domain-containing protein [Pseudorhodobacter turbinis]